MLIYFHPITSFSVTTYPRPDYARIILVPKSSCRRSSLLYSPRLPSPPVPTPAAAPPAQPYRATATDVRGTIVLQSCGIVSHFCHLYSLEKWRGELLEIQAAFTYAFHLQALHYIAFPFRPWSRIECSFFASLVFSKNLFLVREPKKQFLWEKMALFCSLHPMAWY